MPYFCANPVFFEKLEKFLIFFLTFSPGPVTIFNVAEKQTVQAAKPVIYGPLVKWPKTPPFHGGNRGSNPLRVTKNYKMMIYVDKLSYYSYNESCVCGYNMAR